MSCSIFVADNLTQMLKYYSRNKYILFNSSATIRECIHKLYIQFNFNLMDGTKL